MTEHVGSMRRQSEMQITSAAFALLNLSTSDDLFIPSPSRASIHSPRITPYRSPTTCDACFGQNIQRKNSLLYHVKLIKEHLDKDPDKQIHEVRICGTFTDFLCAESAAHDALDDELPLGTTKALEIKRDFTSPRKWAHEDEVYAHAVAHTGETYTVSIETEPNHSELVGNSHGEVCGKYYQALQRIIHYSEDRHGLKRTIHIKGSYRTRNAARHGAEKALLSPGHSLEDDFDDFQIFDEKSDSRWGKDVYIHAVSPIGDSYLMSVVEVERENTSCGD